jgi:hypothetical protein
MPIIQNGPREFHLNWTPKPGEELENEPDSYFTEAGIVGDHFLFDYLSDWRAKTKISRDNPWSERKEASEVFGRFFDDPENNFAADPDIWELDQESFEGDILDIIFTDSFQNLRGKAQHGPVTHFMNRLPVSRFEHSIDSLFLLRALGVKSDVEIEPGLQIYALDHDGGQGAFSHTSEDVIGGDHEVHEERAREVLKAEGLWGKEGEHEEGIVDKYGDIFSNDYPVMDASKPDLSIDRLAYILKDASRLKGSEAFFYDNLTGNLPGREPREDSFEWTSIGEILEATEIQEEGDERYLVMTDPEAAGKVAEIYMDLEEKAYFHPGYNAFNRGFSDAARIALNRGEIDVGDLFSLPDIELMERLGHDPVARNHLDKVFEHFIYGEGLEHVEEGGDITVGLRRDVVDPRIREYEDQDLSDMDRASEYDKGLKARMKEHERLDGRELEFNVINWDYPDVEPYTVDGAIDAKRYQVPRIVEPGTQKSPVYWRRIREKYREEDKKAGLCR